MRFKNLTITITLTGLSIVALAGLIMLPISNGVCDWSGGKSSKSYSESLLDDDEQGWDLSISLFAGRNNASVSVSPSINCVEVFTSEITYSGRVNIQASRSSGYKWGWVYCGYDNGCEYYKNCPGHQQVVKVNAVSDPESKVIYTTVDYVETMFVKGREKHLITRKHIGATVTHTVGLEKYASVTRGGNVYWWVQEGKKYWETISEKRINPAAGLTDGASASVKNYPTVNSRAEILSLTFEHPIAGNGDISTTNSVSYKGVPVRPRTPR